MTARTDMGGSVSSIPCGWDEDGNRTGVNGMIYQYDGLDRLTGIFNGSLSGPLAAFAYSPDGSVGSVGNMWSTAVTASTGFQRDPAGRLGTLSQSLGGSVSNQTTFTYNAASQIVGRTGSNDAYG